MAQIGRILNSRYLRDAPTLQNFLRFVVEETLKGSGEKLNVSTIARSVFGRGPEFSNTTDSVVRVAAHRLRTTLSHYDASNIAGETLVISLEPGCYSPSISFATCAEDSAWECPAHC